MPTETRTCARATPDGLCGHLPNDHRLDSEDGSGYCTARIDEVDTPIYKGPIRCSCIGWRSQEQQELWLELAACIGTADDVAGNPQERMGALMELRLVAKDLLELYPNGEPSHAH